MRTRLAGLVLVLAWATCACATGLPARTAGPTPPSPAAAADHPSHDPLEQPLARARVLAEKASTGRRRASVPSVESTDPLLLEALARLEVDPTPARYHAVASAYLHAGIPDRAFDYLTAALRLDRTDAAAYDGLARIWRDWGFPQLGLSDAHRAVFFAPESPSAHNTLGTLLQALGQLEAARRTYRTALSLDPRAAYALNNLCSLDLARGRLADATRSCTQALALDPTLLAARRNLATLAALGPSSAPRTVTKETASETDGSGKPPGD